MKTVSLICHFEGCRASFSRPKREFERQERNGRHVHFCSRKCAAFANRKFLEAGQRNGSVTNLNASNRRDEFTPFRKHFRSARARGCKGKVCDLTLEILKDQWEQQQGLCAYTYLEMRGKGALQPSLDRIDSSRGYTKDNIQYVCKAINLAKSTLSDKEMRDFLELVRKTHFTAARR
jgi:hypothetical protein